MNLNPSLAKPAVAVVIGEAFCHFKQAAVSFGAS